MAALEITIDGDTTDTEGNETSLSDVSEQHIEGGPKKNVPPIGSPRWEEVYHKMKEYERKALANESKMEEYEKKSVEYNALLEHNKQLAEAIDKLSGTLEKGNQVEDVVGKLTAELDSLKAAKKEARTALDFDKADEIDEKILDLRDKIKDAKLVKPAASTTTSTVTKSADDLAYDAWVTANPWFKSKPKMKQYAQGLDTTMGVDPEWSDKPFKDRLVEIAQRTKEKFGMATTKKVDDQTGGESGVEGGTFRTGGGKGTKVTLTSDEVIAAQITGLTPQEYAKQKLAINKARGI